MTAEEFVAAYEARSGVEPGTMRHLGRYPEACSCEEDGCEGWQMGHQHEDALADDVARSNLWAASDGTIWFWTGGRTQEWTGWQPGEDGVWCLRSAEFRRNYPDAPPWEGR